MKVRIQERMLRFRLKPQDLDQLKNKKSCTEFLEISPELRLEFTIQLKADAKMSRVATEGSTVTIDVPDHVFLDWLEGGENEWDFTQAHPRLDISIEKDFRPHHVS